MFILVLIFCMGLIPYNFLVAGEGVSIGNSIFYDGIDAEHEHEEDHLHEDSGEGHEEEETHHHHHASHTPTVTTTNPIVVSAGPPIGSTPINSMQEVGLTKYNQGPTIDDKKPLADSYQQRVAPVSADLFSLGLDDVQEDQDPITQFFRSNIWEDHIFQESILEEYRKFFDEEIERLRKVEASKEGKVVKLSKEKKNIINTEFFKKALANFKQSAYGIQFQNELESYITIITKIVNIRKKIKSQEIEGLVVKRLKKVSMVGDEVTAYVITYEGNNDDAVYVTERSMRVLFGDSFFRTFLRKRENSKDIVIFIPYKSLLDLFSNQNSSFSLSLLRRKIYYSDCCKE